MVEKNIKRKISVIFVAVLAVAISMLIAVSSLISLGERNLEHGKYILGSEANKMQYAIDSRLLNLEILEMLIVNNGGMIDNFDEVGSMIYKQDKAIRCIQLAPNGMITHIYPVEGNESGFGNLFANPARRDEAIYARDSGNMTLAGPFELHQGGIGVVARRPIYLTGEQGEKEFWGFSIQVMDLEALLNAAQLSNLEKDGYYYQIYKFDRETHEKEVFHGIETISEEAITSEIQVPGNTWYLSLIPKEGWISKRSIITYVSLAIIIALLLTIIAYYIFTAENKKDFLSKMVKTDQLTGLQNSRHFYDTLNKSVSKRCAFALYYIDLDKFKAVNDIYGHLVGDRVLAETGRIIRSVIDEADTGFRIGGDEFAIISFVDDKRELCENTCQKIRKAFEKPFIADEKPISMGVSIGYALFPDDANDIERLIQTADSRMYKEKGEK